MTVQALSLFADLALAGPPSSSAEGSTRSTRDTRHPAPGAAPNVRPSDPHTSHAAAADSEGRHGIAQRVLAVHERYPLGLTDHELFALTGLPARCWGSVVKRRADFAHCVDSGRTRMGPNGRECIVWVLPGGGAS